MGNTHKVRILRIHYRNYSIETMYDPYEISGNVVRFIFIPF